jgi:hypothetical protein
MGIPKKVVSTVNPVIAYTDLRSITREANKCHTSVVIHLDWETKVKWLEFGQAEIRFQKESSQSDGRHRLEARMTSGVTDFEHDSAFAVRLPITGLTFQGVLYHRTRFTAWIDPNEDPKFSPDFRVPRPGYNPAKHKDAHKCTQCKGKESHIIVPEGFYVPPFDAELYEAVRGKMIEISIGPVFEE